MSIFDQKYFDTPQEQTDYPVLDPGTYEFEVVKTTLKEYTPRPTSRIGHCAQLDVQLRINDKYNVFESLFFDPTTLWKATQFAKAIGIYDAKNGISPIEADKKAVGMIGQSEFIIEEYNGKKRNRVRRFIEKKPVQIKPEELPF